jgi:hypothetical protein
MTWSGYAGVGTYDGVNFVESTASSYARQEFEFSAARNSRVSGLGPTVTFTSDDTSGEFVNAIAFYADPTTTSSLLVYPFVAPMGLGAGQPVNILPSNIVVDYVDQTTQDGQPLNLVTFGEISGVSGPGMVKLASGTITSPIAFLDLELPAPYVAFQLQFVDLGLQNAVSDIIGGATSIDGGATFLGNFGTYSDVIQLADWAGSPFFSAVSSGISSAFSVGYGGCNHNSVTLDISPGPPFICYQQGTSVDASTGTVYALKMTSTWFGGFTPPTQPINAVRFADANYWFVYQYGGDPSTVVPLASGSYVLWGIQP